jgi:hypothetical protein
LLLTACGGSDAETTTTATPATTAAPTTTTTEAPTTTAAPTTTEATTTTETPFEAPDGALVSVAADAPTLDGVADEAAWTDAAGVTVSVAGGANAGAHDVTVKSVYSDDMVYFLVTWDDATEDHLRSPWEKQADGSWMQLSNPDDPPGHGGNNTYYEDKMSMIWNINATPMANFETVGCTVACHSGENSDIKAYGNKYTAEEGEFGDIWHWKSVRNVAQLDDQYLDSTRWSEDTDGAGRHGDPKDGGGYNNNVVEEGGMPAFMVAGGGDRNGDPGYILETDIVDFDDSIFVEGDLVPGVITAPFTGDRGDLSAGYVWDDGVWTVELSRKMVTGSEFDVQFDDMAGVYHFGVAIFDNAQTMHSYQAGANPFVFKP